MIPALVVLAGVVALVALLVVLEKRSGGPDSWQEPVVSGELVTVARSLSVGEAEVALRLLESQGIRVRRDTSGPELRPGARIGGETRCSLSVAPEDADEARALLGQ